MADDFEDLEYLRKLDDFFDGKVQMTGYRELEKRGQAPPQPEGLSDEEIRIALTNLVWGLADLGVDISDTEHLSDRELYHALLAFCDEPSMFFPDNPRAMVGWSPIGSGTDADTEIYLRYYADDKTRKRWAREFRITLPPQEIPPYPRPWIPRRELQPFE